MYRLTERRLQTAQGILEKYREQFLRNLQFDAHTFEQELRKCWHLGYQEFKSIARNMLRIPRYRHVAVFYMEKINAPVVVSEFQAPLARVYGIRHYDDPERQQKREKFWASFKAMCARKHTQ